MMNISQSDCPRRAKEREAKIVHMQRLVDEARAGGASTRSMNEIRKEALRQAGSQRPLILAHSPLGR